MNDLQAVTRPGSTLEPMTDLQRILQRTDLGFVPLARDDRGLLEALPSLGSLTWFHGGRHVQIARTGRIQRILPGDSGTALLDSDGGLLWIGAQYRHALAALRREERHERPSLLLFSDQGMRMLQLILEDARQYEAFRELLHAHQGGLDGLRHAPAPSPSPASGTLNHRWALHEAWRTAASRADLHARLRGLGLDAYTAVRALEGLHTSLLGPAQLAWCLRRMAELQVPVHVEVEHAGAAVALEARWEDLQLEDQAWRLAGPDCTLWVAPGTDASAWWVMQGDTCRMELFDASGASLLSVGLRPEDPRTRKLLTEWDAAAIGR